MTLQSLGNLGEFISSVAVLITLIYLARQYHQSTEAKRNDSLNLALGTHVHLIAQITATDERAELFRRFCEDFSALSLNERGRAHTMILDLLVSFNQVLRLHMSRLLDDEEFNAIRGTFISILRTGGGRFWWEAYKHMVPDFLNARVSEMINDTSIQIRPVTEEQSFLFR